MTVAYVLFHNFSCVTRCCSFVLGYRFIVRYADWRRDTVELYEHCNRSVRLTISYSVICKFFIKGLLNCRLICIIFAFILTTKL